MFLKIRLKISNLMAPFILIRIFDSNNAPIEEYISPYPVAHRGSDEILFGYAITLSTPLELFPDKSTIHFILKDYNPMNSNEVLVGEGKISLNKNSLKDILKKHLIFHDPIGNKICKISIETKLSRVEPITTNSSVFDYFLTADLAESYFESYKDLNLRAHGRLIPVNEDVFCGFVVVKCIGFDENESNWTWTITSATEDYQAGEVMESVGGLESVDAVAPFNLLKNQKFLFIFPVHYLLNADDTDP